MWDAVVGAVNPENTSEIIFNVFAVESITIVAEPVPGDPFGGDSPGPVIITLYVIGPAKRLPATSRAPHGIHIVVFIVNPPRNESETPNLG